MSVATSASVTSAVCFAPAASVSSVASAVAVASVSSVSSAVAVAPVAIASAPVPLASASAPVAAASGLRHGLGRGDGALLHQPECRGFRSGVPGVCFSFAFASGVGWWRR